MPQIRREGEGTAKTSRTPGQGKGDARLERQPQLLALLWFS
jgi:hypothetical protein